MSTTSLRTAQIRILNALNDSKHPLSKAGICEAVASDFPTAAKFQAWMADPIGSRDPATSKAAQVRCGYPSLLTLGYVRAKEQVVEPTKDSPGVREYVYEITASGKQALTNYAKEQVATEKAEADELAAKEQAKEEREAARQAKVEEKAAAKAAREEAAKIRQQEKAAEAKEKEQARLAKEKAKIAAAKAVSKK